MPSTTPVAGFAELYERHYEAVFRAALRVTGNPADAEDVLQTVFLRVLARGGDVEDVALPAAYFRRAAVNAAVDVLRRRELRARVGLRRSGAARCRPAPFAAEGAASARHRRRGQRGRQPVPAASRRGAVESKSWPGCSGSRRTTWPSGSTGSGTGCRRRCSARRDARRLGGAKREPASEALCERGLAKRIRRRSARSV